VALDAAFPPDRLAFVIADAALKFVITNGATCRSALLERLVNIDLNADARLIDAQRSSAPNARVGAESLAYVAYTSGSTGRPKGVAVVDRGVLRLVRGANYVEIDRDDVFLHLAPVAFDASTFEIWAPLLSGARLAIAPPGTLSLDELGRVFHRFGVTTLWLTASLFRLLVDAELDSLRDVRQLLVGGDVVPVEQAIRFLEAFPSCRLIDGYGPTENTTFSCCYRVPSPEAIRTGVPIGRPISNSTAFVLDERMQPVAVGSTGELYVGGDGLARGYVNLPELTAERFVADPFSPDPRSRLYRTGDLCRYRADGVLEFIGRIDHQIKIRGHRIELGEIERAIQSHPGVTDATVSVLTSGADKALFAHVVPNARDAVDERAMRAHLERTLPAYMVPGRYAFVPDLPKHPSGKIDRVELARRAHDARPAPKAPAAYGRRGAVQRTICACWNDALGSTGEADLDENFFDAGGDSLRLLALHGRLQKELGVELCVVDLFEQSTIRKLTAFVNARVA
ncbi:MAG: non-ribosomal peptide synthetase, partial [Candidatus Eremiobacteraeota bacterium]|nr:non-ribosomal peptide synthetase [Candidatus Eremiobacteraeota bacterium]